MTYKEGDIVTIKEGFIIAGFPENPGWSTGMKIMIGKSYSITCRNVWEH